MPTPVDPNAQDDPLAAALAEAKQAALAPKSSPGAKPASPSAGTPGGAQSFAAGVADTAAFGFADEVGGFISAVIPGEQAKGTSGFWNSGKSFGDTVSSNIAALRAQQAGAAATHPWLYHGGQVLGAVVVPAGAAPKSVASAAKIGAGQGAAYGAGSGTDTKSRATGAVEGAGMGAAAGGLLYKAGGLIAKGVRKVLGREPSPVTPNVTEAVTPPVTTPAQAVPEGPILGTTKGGVPILGSRQAANEATGAEAKSLAETVLPSGAPQEAATGGLVKAGGSGAGKGPPPSGGLPAAPSAVPEPDARAALERLKAGVNQQAAVIKAHGDRAADITWETTPQAAAQSGEMRIGALSTTEEAQAFVHAVGVGTTEKIVRTDAELNAAAKSIADEIGLDPEALKAYAQSTAGDLHDIDVRVQGLRMAKTVAATEISHFHLLNVDWSTASDDLVKDGIQRIYNFAGVMQDYVAVKSALGRGLRTLGLPTSETFLKAADEASAAGVAGESRGLVPVPSNRQELGDWLDLWGMTDGNPAKQADMMEKLLQIPTPGLYVRQSLANWFTSFILSAPKTIGLNVVGPAVISTLRNVERYTGAALNSIDPLLSPAERQAASLVRQNTAKAWASTLGDIGDAFSMAVRAGSVNHTIIGGHGQSLDVRATMGPFTENMLKFAGRNPDGLSGAAYSLGNLINGFPRVFARVNNGLDEFSKRMAYNGEVRINAMVEGAQKGLAGKDLTDFVQTALRNSTDEVGKATNEALLRSAERTTLTMSPGGEKGVIKGFSSWLQRARADVPELRYVVPVFNVPVNGLGEVMRRLPIARIPGLNQVMFRETVAELNGELGPVAQADAHGRTLLGAAFLTAGLMLNHHGSLTGAGPQDPTDRKIWLLTHQPYSILINGTWVAYNKFDIAGGLLAIPATVADATIYSPNDQGNSEVAMAAVGSLAQWFKDQAALRTVGSILNAGSDPTQNAGSLFQNLGGSISAGMAVPAFMRTLVTDTTSPEVAMKNSWLDYVKAATPGLANSVEPLRNVLGEPVMKPANTVGEALLPVSLVKAVGYDTDPVLDELDRLYQQTGYGAGANSSSVSRGFFDERAVKLENGKSLYTSFMQARQTMKLGRLTLREALQKAFDSPAYARAVDADSGQKITSKGQQSRGAIISAVFNRYNGAIKATLAKESPTAKAWMTAADAKAKDDAYLRDVPVEELVANPTLYRTHGLNQHGYEGRLLRGQTGELQEALRQ